MADEMNRVERLLAMLLVHDMHDAPQADRAVALSRAGFAHAEIAELLGTSATVIKQQVYLSRRTKKRAKGRAKGGKKGRR